MLIAIGSFQYGGIGALTETDGSGGARFTLVLNLYAYDSSQNIQESQASVQVHVPGGTPSRDFNDLISAAIEGWVNSFTAHGWTIDPKNIFFPSFTNGA